MLKRVTRRNFLKSSSTALVAGAVLGAAPIEALSSVDANLQGTHPAPLVPAVALEESNKQRLLSGWEHYRGGLGGAWEVWRKANDDTSVWRTVTLPHCF